MSDDFALRGADKHGWQVVLWMQVRLVWVVGFRAIAGCASILLWPCVLLAESAHSAPDPTIVERCLKAADFEGCYRTLSERGSGQASGSSALSGYRDIDYRSLMRSEGVRKTVSIVNGAGGECKLVAYETVLDVCGTFVGKANVVGWTRSHVQTSCNFLGWCPGEQFNYGLSFFSESGRSALQFSILHRPTAYDMDKFLTSWIGMIHQRTDGDKLLEPGMPFVAPVIIR